MSRPNLLTLTAWSLHVTAWFLPVVTSVGGGSIHPPITGAYAFVMATSAVVPGGFSGTWYQAAFSILSVLTTIFFVFGSPWVVLKGKPRLKKASAWIAVGAFVLNVHWYLSISPNGWISGLGVGYFLWWASFLLLAAGLFDASRHEGVQTTDLGRTVVPSI